MSHDLQDVVERLAARVDAQEQEIRALRSRRGATWFARLHGRRTRVLVTIAVALVIAATPAVLVASHSFGDVPDGHTFHGNIGAIHDARIAAGCTATVPPNYCPGDPVTRGQMAAFLHRGLGRVAASQASVSGLGTSANNVVTSVTVEAGGVTGGTGFLLVTGSGSLRADDPGVCPCTLSVRPRLNGTTQPSLFEFEVIPDVAGPFGDFRFGSASISWVFPVSSGTTHTVELLANTTVTSGTVLVQGHLTAAYVPFGSTGGDSLESSVAEPATEDGLPAD